MRLVYLVVLFITTNLFSFDYDLKPIKLSENSYYLYGKEEYFSPQNGGNIVNTAFIITKNSVILIDTGSTYQYAQQLKKAIAKITNKPIKYVFNTHHHPDHFLGNMAFKNQKIYATNYTIDEIKSHGELYVTNIANLVGKAAYETRSFTPNKELHEKELDFDGYKLKLIYLDGHTQDDVVIYDENTKIIYTADLIFNHRALATPHANIPKWISSLENLKKVDFNILVPGHGKVTDKKVLDENIGYLTFLDTTLKNAVDEGLDTFEILTLDVPKEFSDYSMFKEEYERSIINLYPKYERQ